MTQISAKVIKDSVGPRGDRPFSVMVTFPRYILAELNTHRMFSRNSASSRAIPFNKMLQMVRDNPFIPVAFQKDHSGMQGSHYIENHLSLGIRMKQWLEARDAAIAKAEEMHTPLTELYKEHPEYENYVFEDDEPVTKQMVNRILEPYMWHTVMITATEWENFFELRCPRYVTPVAGEGFTFRSRKDCIANHSAPENLEKMEKFTELEWLKLNTGQADIHMMFLAEAIWDCYNTSTPDILQPGQWHLPFGETEFDKVNYFFSKNDLRQTDSATEKLTIQIATARAARVSYTVVGEEGKPADYEKDVELHDRLLKSGHMSPFEHCCKVMTEEEYQISLKGEIKNGGGYQIEHGWSGNLRGFIQYRKLLPNENFATSPYVIKE